MNCLFCRHSRCCPEHCCDWDNCSCGDCAACGGDEAAIHIRRQTIHNKNAWEEDRRTRCKSNRRNPQERKLEQDEIRDFKVENKFAKQELDIKREEESTQKEQICQEIQEIVNSNKQTLQKTNRTLSKIQEALNSIQSLNSSYQKFKNGYNDLFKQMEQKIHYFYDANEEIHQERYGYPQIASTESCADLLRNSYKIVILTGRTPSIEQHYWINGTKMKHEEFLSMSTFKSHPREFWAKMQQILKLFPDLNDNHLFIRALSEITEGKGGTLHVVTQNIDGLYKVLLDSSKVFEIHGDLHYSRCMNGCSERFRTPSSGLPICPKCKGQARPHVLLFDEKYNEDQYKIRSAKTALEEADCLVAVDCTVDLKVPNKLLFEFARSGKPIIDVSNGNVKYGNVYVTMNPNTLPNIIRLI